MANDLLTQNEDIACLSTIDGEYRLGAVIGRSIRSTVYEIQPGGEHDAAVIKIRERDAEDGEDPAGRIRQGRSAMELAHPNLLEIYAVGSSMLNNIPVSYAVLERADETLEGVLQTRPLTGEETRQMLMSATEALRYLHKKGYAHSRLRASNVLAVGEQVKLSSDSVTRMADGGSAAEDMQALGILIVQALTQHSPNADSTVGVPEDILQPFRDVSEHCLDPDPALRWTAEQALARLTTPDTVRPLPTHQLHMGTYQLHTAVKAPADAEHDEETHREDDSNRDNFTKGIPKWIYVGLAALVLLVFLLAGLRKKDSAAGAGIPPKVVQEQAPAAVSVPGPLNRDSPVGTDRLAQWAGGAGGRKADGWSVIVAAYSSREPAEKRMREMARKWPSFNPGIFQPLTGKTHYIVVLGQNLSEDQAEALRKRAVAAGLPRDTYIKKVM